jgi:hypothetical protein
VTDLSFILRDRRDEITRHWLALLPGVVADDYREVLESPIGARLAHQVIDDLVSYTEAEEYEAPTTLHRVAEAAAAEAARRAALGFSLDDLLAGLQLLREAMWDALMDALVVGELPPLGETMAQMKVVDGFLDYVLRAIAGGFTGAPSR